MNAYLIGKAAALPFDASAALIVAAQARLGQARVAR